MRTDTTRETTGSDVVRWRHEQLAQSGFARPLAARLSSDPRYDLHALIQLVESGCRPELAARILSPLEAERVA